jgi:hypothetical protein
LGELAAEEFSARWIVEGEGAERVEHAVLAGDAAIEGFHADDGDHVLRRHSGFLARLLEPRAMLEHELRAFGDALLGHEARTVFVPGRHAFRGLGHRLDDLRLRLGLREQAIDFERFHLLRRRGCFDERANLGAIEIEPGATGERAVRERETREKQCD